MPANEEEVRVSLGLNLATLKTGFDKATVMAQEWGKEFSRSLASSGKALLAPLTGVGALGFLKTLGDKAEQIDRVSTAVGVNAETYQRLAYTFRQVGSDADQAERSLQKLADTIGEAREGDKSRNEIFERWGIALNDANGIALDTTAIVEEIAKRMDENSDATEKAAMATELFGRGAVKVVAALKEWKELHGGGAMVFSNQDVADIKAASDGFKSMADNVQVGVWKYFFDGFAKIGAAAAYLTGSLHQDTDAYMVQFLKDHRVYLDYLKAEAAAKAEAKVLDEQAAEAAKQKAADAKQDFINASEANYAKAEEKRLETLKRIAEEEKRITAERRQQEIHSKQDALYKAEERAREGTYHTLEELAGVRMNAPAYNIARELLARQARLSQYTLLYGMDTKAAEESGIIRRLKSTLEESGFIMPEEHLKAMKDGIEVLVKKAESEGLNVNVQLQQ